MEKIVDFKIMTDIPKRIWLTRNTATRKEADGYVNFIDQHCFEGFVESEYEHDKYFNRASKRVFNNYEYVRGYLLGKETGRLQLVRFPTYTSKVYQLDTYLPILTNSGSYYICEQGGKTSTVVLTDGVPKATSGGTGYCSLSMTGGQYYCDNEIDIEYLNAIVLRMIEIMGNNQKQLLEYLKNNHDEIIQTLIAESQRRQAEEIKLAEMQKKLNAEFGNAFMIRRK